MINEKPHHVRIVIEGDATPMMILSLIEQASQAIPTGGSITLDVTPYAEGPRPF